MRPRAVRSRLFTIALPVLFFIAGISATCGVSKGETRNRQVASQEATTVSISPVRP